MCFQACGFLEGSFVGSVCVVVSSGLMRWVGQRVNAGGGGGFGVGVEVHFDVVRVYVLVSV